MRPFPNFIILRYLIIFYKWGNCISFTQKMFCIHSYTHIFIMLHSYLNASERHTVITRSTLDGSTHCISLWLQFQKDSYWPVICELISELFAVCKICGKPCLHFSSWWSKWRRMTTILLLRISARITCQHVESEVCTASLNCFTYPLSALSSDPVSVCSGLGRKW